MRILIATDFSTRSHRALRRGGHLAGCSRGEIMLMHVVEGFRTKEVAQDLREDPYARFGNVGFSL